MSAPDTLLIDDGGLCSLALLAIQPDTSRLMLWHEHSADARLRVVRAHARLCGEQRLIVTEPTPLPVAEFDPPPHVAQMETLLRASALAAHFGCARVLWPVAVGPDHVLNAQALEPAVTMAHLADPSGSLFIDAPILDLSDAEVVDLADEAGAPMRTFWPCEADEDQPCESCGECARWREAFKTAGVRWPWAATRDARRGVNEHAERTVSAR